MRDDEAHKALERAEAILEKSYAFTEEVKLFPLALQQLQKAVESAWKAEGGKKPRLLQELENIISQRKESPLEFKRKEKLVICSENYKTTILEEKKLRVYIKKTKRYLEKCKKKT